jgi:2-polyprenyl-3-methyl-5-hydroxy-6-metoxy-1,4-benzoquinol methylase
MSVSALPPADLEFDGERFVPGAGVEIAYHHWLRYQLAVRLAAGKRVLDVASGEGYGAAMLARVAREVTAFDANDRAVRHARRAYVDQRHVTFQCAGIEEFFGGAEACRYDLVTAFEIIEHVDEKGQRELVDGIQRVLVPGGLALVSTPDKRLYTDARLSRNPFHVREMYRREFDALLREAFPHVCILEQVACTGSAIFKPGAKQGDLTRAAWTDLLRLKGSCEVGLEGEGEYLVALVSDQPISEEATVALALLDPAKKLIGEELYATQVALEATRREAAKEQLEKVEARAAAKERLEKMETRERENEGLRQRLAGMEDVAERLALVVGRAQDEITRGQRLEAELAQANHALAHLRQMLGVRAVLKARAALDKRPRLKRAVNALTRRLR